MNHIDVKSGTKHARQQPIRQNEPDARGLSSSEHSYRHQGTATIGTETRTIAP